MYMLDARCDFYFLICIYIYIYIDSAACRVSEFGAVCMNGMATLTDIFTKLKDRGKTKGLFLLVVRQNPLDAILCT